MKLTPALPAILLCAAPAEAAQPLSDSMAREIDRIASEAVENAAENEEKREAQRATDLLTVRNSMKQIERSPNGQLAEQLPLPTFIGYREILAALDYPSAWRDSARGHDEDQEAKDALADFVLRGSFLYYGEWSCGTGAENTIAKQTIDLLPQVVTEYPERLLLIYFIKNRRLLGYSGHKDCDFDGLDNTRARYQRAVKAILEL
jgi:hypothetical protein